MPRVEAFYARAIDQGAAIIMTTEKVEVDTATFQEALQWCQEALRLGIPVGSLSDPDGFHLVPPSQVLTLTVKES